MMKNAPYSVPTETLTAARTAALAGTRQMIADIQFETLVALLIDCGAVPRPVMAIALRRLADGMIAAARGELETEYAVYPAELFERARRLDANAAAVAQ